MQIVVQDSRLQVRRALSLPLDAPALTLSGSFESHSPPCLGREKETTAPGAASAASAAAPEIPGAAQECAGTHGTQAASTCPLAPPMPSQCQTLWRHDALASLPLRTVPSDVGAALGTILGPKENFWVTEIVRSRGSEHLCLADGRG